MGKGAGRAVGGIVDEECVIACVSDVTSPYIGFQFAEIQNHVYTGYGIEVLAEIVFCVPVCPAVSVDVCTGGH